MREPQDGGASDVIALQVVTVGAEASRRTDALQARGDYSESYFLHGFSVQSAEALAERTHRRIRAELGLRDERGKRYSWGYGACPDLSQHEIVWRLLDVENAIGASLTSAHQIMPEQSTAAIVIHHPRAAYFNAAAVRELARCSAGAPRRARVAQRRERASRWIAAGAAGAGADRGRRRARGSGSRCRPPATTAAKAWPSRRRSAWGWGPPARSRATAPTAAC